MQATTASRPGCTSRTSAKPACRAARRDARMGGERARSGTRSPPSSADEVVDRFRAAEEPARARPARRGGIDDGAVPRPRPRREAPVGRDRVDRRARFDETFGQPVAAAVAAHDEHAAAAPVGRAQLLPRALRSRTAAHRPPARRSPPPARPRCAGSRRCRPGAAGEQAGRPARHRPAVQRRSARPRSALTNTTRPRSRQPSPRRLHRPWSRGGAMSISGSATASMPRAISRSTQASACARGRVTIRRGRRARSDPAGDGSAEAPAAR